MKEARIILPIDRQTAEAAQICIDNIRDEFHGATVYRGVGVWKFPSTGQPISEDVSIVDIAYPPSDENDTKLYDIAWQFREDAKQQEVYLRYGNGHVQMVSEKSCMDNGHGHFDLSFGGVIDAMNDLTDPGKSGEDRLSAFEYLESALVSRGKKRHDDERSDLDN